MSELTSWAIVLGLAVGTFLIRYSFIGLFANRPIPPWLEHGLKLMVPAIFGAIVFTGVALLGGQLVGFAQWPRFAAAVVALGFAIRTQGNILWTVGAGMAALHLLPWLAAFVGT